MKHFKLLFAAILLMVSTALATVAKWLGKYIRCSGLAVMVNLYSQRTYDAATLLRATAANITSTEIGALILDVGKGLLDADLVIDITTIDTTTGDESYVFALEGSSDALFGTAANITILALLVCGGVAGALTATPGAPLGALSTAGRYLVPFRNERNGTTYRYLRLLTTLNGTTPILAFTAWVAKDE